jgi:hypothetical protein
MVGYNWVVWGLVVGVLDSVMGPVLDPNSSTGLRLRSSIKSNCYELSGAILEGEWREQIPRAVGKHPTAPNSGLQPDGHFVAFRRAKR